MSGQPSDDRIQAQSEPISEAQFQKDLDFLDGFRHEIQSGTGITQVRKRKIKAQIRDHFAGRGTQRYERAEWTEKVLSVAREIAQQVNLKGVRICATDVLAPRHLQPFTPHDLDTRQPSFEETRRSFQESRLPHIELFQQQLSNLAGVEFESREKARAVLDEVNATRRMLAVSFLFGDEEQRASLCLVAGSFQVKTTEKPQKQLYAGKPFPRIRVLDPQAS